MICSVERNFEEEEKTKKAVPQASTNFLIFPHMFRRLFLSHFMKDVAQ